MTILEFSLRFFVPIVGFIAGGYILCWLREQRKRIDRESIQNAAIRRAFQLGEQQGRKDWWRYIDAKKN